MNYYSLTQWLIFFFMYCFIGWVWESCFVSIKQHKWVNRGFLHGPFLPIYGTGAIAILFTTLPVKGNTFYVFLFGMLAATILEYVTGVLMEKIFGVRYWDYTGKFMNVNGHICLSSSICWGFFSCLLIYVIHGFFEKIVMGIPLVVIDAISFIITVLMVVDITQSFNEAMDLKSMLNKISDEHEHVRIITRRLEIAYAFAEDKYIENRKKYNDRREELSNLANRNKLHLKMYFENKKNDLTDSIEAFKDTKMIGLSETMEKAKILFREKIIDENIFGAVIDVVEKEQDKLKHTDNQQFNRIAKILRRNPDAVSKNNSEAMEEIKHITKK